MRGTVRMTEEGSTVFKKDGGVAILIFSMACTPVPESDTADQCLTKAQSAHVPVRLILLARKCIANIKQNKHL
jgi:hypothetical protein